MKVDTAELRRLEARLEASEVPEDSIPLLLEAVRHLLRCHDRRAAAKASTERRRKGCRRRDGKKKGHGRNGAADYPGAKHVACSHPDLKVGGLCPGCGRGRLYDCGKRNDVELNAASG